MKLDNKKLIIVLVALVVLLALVKIFRSSGRDSNQRSELFKIDTASITKINIYPVSEQKKEMQLVRDGNTWKLQRGEKVASMEPAAVSNLLGNIGSLRVERLISRKKEKQDEYQVSDSTGTHVMIYAGSQVVANWWVGQSAGGTAYARLDDDDDIYIINSYLAGTFTRPFNAWRDKTFIRLNPDSIASLSVQYPADSGFVVAKTNGAWMVGQEQADSIGVIRYLSKFRTEYLNNFVDEFAPSTTPDVTITANQGALFTIKAWKQPEGDTWILHSTQNPDAYFTNEGSSIIKDLFVPKKSLLPAENKD